MVTLTLDGYRVNYYSKDMQERVQVRKALTFLHPNPWDVPAYKEGKWNGIITKYKNTDLSFSVGLLHYVIARLDEEKIKYTLVGFESDLSWVKFSSGISANERDYQRNAILAWLQTKIGIIKVPTRGGKTYIAGEIVRILLELCPNFNFLFLTDSKDAFDPARKDLGSFIAREMKEVGEIREKKRNYSNVTVAMIQTIQSALRNKDRDLEKWLKKVDVLIVDEIHEYYSKPRQRIIEKIKKNTTYLLAISATPEKESDFLGWLNIQDIVGSVIYDIHQKDLEQRGVLAKNKVLLITNNIKASLVDDELPYFDIVKEHIYHNDKRNSLLINIIKACERTGVKTLVMFSSKVHGNLIAEQTGKVFLSGDDDSTMRKAIKDAFLQLDGEVLLVSEIWKKAITLPEVEVFVNADGGKEDTLITQKKGRVLGVSAGKNKALVIDIIDSCSKYFSEHSISRLLVYENSNDSDDIDFMEDDVYLEENLVKYINEWFHGS